MERRNHVVISSSLVAMPLDRRKKKQLDAMDFFTPIWLFYVGVILDWLGWTTGLQFWILRIDGGRIGH
jgi:hypothetical protein